MCFYSQKASADIEPEISRSVKTVVDDLNAYLDKRIDMRMHQDEKFIGFFIEPPDKQYFENIAYAFVDAVKAIRKLSLINYRKNIVFCHLPIFMNTHIFRRRRI